MGEVHQQQEEPTIAIRVPNHICQMCGDQTQQQQQQPILDTTTTAATGGDDYSAVDPTTSQFSMMHLNSCSACKRRRRRRFHASAVNKRRSPSSSSSGEPSAKKLFSDQEDLTRHGFSAVSLPFPVLRRTVSASPELAADLPGYSTPPARRSGLPPLPPSLRRTVSDLSPSPVKASPRSLSSEETTPDSTKLRKMGDLMREMMQRCDEVMKTEEEGDEECAVAEIDKVPSQDELHRDSEEAVSVEWAEKCLRLAFRCPCGKGYEVLLSENNCYYKLV
ncbi:uncharacterized protein LOC130732339 [Lotus japonicus]|uniref:uncharacterized protein LOC130732339 n=1 Tax=Lotus japonicus TaxID=34305 RepID=UPI00258AED5B|nr:uncharacterized protein LOC130732339 [Lotus japonicus]